MKLQSIVASLVLAFGSGAAELAQVATAGATDAILAGVERVAGIEEYPPQPSVRRAPANRMELDTTVVTGNGELPKVLYIVSWKRAEPGELPAQPFNTLLDEVLEPVDRDELRREVRCHAVVAGSSRKTGTD